MPDVLVDLDLDLEQIEDAAAREWLRRLLNLVEELAAAGRDLQSMTSSAP